MTDATVAPAAEPAPARNPAVTAPRVALDAERTYLGGMRQTARGVAHLFNNLSAVILGRCDLLAESDALPGRDAAHIEVIRQTAAAAAAVARRLQSIAAERQAGADDVIDLAALVRGLVTEVRKSARAKSVQVRVSTPSRRLPTFNGDAALLREAVRQLIGNAFDAMPAGGELTVRLWRSDGLQHLEVRDTGAGMTPDVCAQAADPFFTTKRSPAAGLGLSQAASAAARHGGSLTLTSVVGVGTVVTITLPLRTLRTSTDTDGAATATARASSAVPSHAGSSDEPRPIDSLSVLIVDDDPRVVALTRAMLELDGHTVSSARDGNEALRLATACAAAGTAFDVMLVDVTMPGMPGPELVAALRRAGIATPCVLVSGLDAELTGDRLETAAAKAVLAKPFSLAELRAALARASRAALSPNGRVDGERERRRSLLLGL